MSLRGVKRRSNLMLSIIYFAFLLLIPVKHIFVKMGNGNPVYSSFFSYQEK